MDYQRQLLDELMGRNRNLDPGAKVKEKSWKDPDFCKFFLYDFCPHDLFINTRADLGACAKIHDEEIKKKYQSAPRCSRKIDIENEFIKLIKSLLNEVDRKIVKGKQRLSLMNSKLEMRPLSKQAEAVANINDKITKLLKEAETSGIRGDVDQAQNLMCLCEKLKEDKDALIKQYESCGLNFSDQQEKQMEVCETCGAFLIVGDAQSRIDDHLMGKQHIGYTRLRKAFEDHQKNSADKDQSSSSSGSNRRKDERSKYRHRSRSAEPNREDERSKYKHRSRNAEASREDDRSKYRRRSRSGSSNRRSYDRHRRDRRSRS